MASIRPTSATIAASYVTALILLVVIVYSFSEPQIVAFTPFQHGIALLALSAVATIIGITAEDPDDQSLRALLLVLAAYWGSLGLFSALRDVMPNNVNVDVQGLFPGYGAFMFIFLIIAIGGLLEKSKIASVLALGFLMTTIFQTVSLWRDMRFSAASYYILLHIVLLYISISYFVRRVRDRNKPVAFVTDHASRRRSRDYTVLGWAMDIVAYAVFASHVTGATNDPRFGLAWMAGAGLFQLVVSVVAIRRSDAFSAFTFSVHGMLWIGIAFNMALELFVQIQTIPPYPVYVLYMVIFLCAGVISLTRDLIQSLQDLLFVIFIISLCVNNLQGRFLGGMGWLGFLFAIYRMFAHMTRFNKSPFKMPIGKRIARSQVIRDYITENLRCCARCFYGKADDRSAVSRVTDEMLGYSKYEDLDMIGFCASAITVLAIFWVPVGQSLIILPWIIFVGGLTHFAVGAIGYARGLTFESSSFITFAAFWLLWGTERGLLDFIVINNPANMMIGTIAFLVVGLLLIGCSLVISKLWTMVSVLFELIVISFLLQALNVPSFNVYERVVAILFVLACLYGFVEASSRMIWGHRVLTVGKPIIQCSYIHSQGAQAFWAQGNRATGVKAIADIMNKGGIVGIPTDVVYVLIAALKFPGAVERAYNTKLFSEDRPMSMWISQVEQLSPGREQFGELLWEFMKEVWPSTISLVIPKGPWLDTLGIGTAEKLIGRPDSIAVRMPNATLTLHLIDQTGPVATTSANPTGEADTTHHLQVLAKLGIENVDGILCDGPSAENMASTVVDCRNINEGRLGFFRIGVVPRSTVEEIFRRVQLRFQSKSMISIASIDPIDPNNDTKTLLKKKRAGNGTINPAFEDIYESMTEARSPSERKTNKNGDPIYRTGDLLSKKNAINLDQHDDYVAAVECCPRKSENIYSEPSAAPVEAAVERVNARPVNSPPLPPPPPPPPSDSADRRPEIYSDVIVADGILFNPTFDPNEIEIQQI